MGKSTWDQLKEDFDSTRMVMKIIWKTLRNEHYQEHFHECFLEDDHMS